MWRKENNSKTETVDTETNEGRVKEAYRWKYWLWEYEFGEGNTEFEGGKVISLPLHRITEEIIQNQMWNVWKFPKGNLTLPAKIGKIHQHRKT